MLNPADLRDVVGMVTEAGPELVDAAFTQALRAAPAWQATPAADRAAILCRAADLLEERLPVLVGLIVREAGKTLQAAIGEIREAVDFLRYYAGQIAPGHRPLGPVVASARGISRSPFLPARSRRRWRRAMWCWPSRRRRPR